MLEWNQSLATGIAEIDEQHKELFNRTNRLLSGMEENRDADQLRELFLFLDQYVVRHFGDEERYIARLEMRGYVEAEEKNFAYVFRPLVRRDQVVRRKLDDLVKRVLGGDIAPLAAYIAENRKLSPTQIAALEKIIQAESASPKQEKSPGAGSRLP